jgi:hypothetical protein
MRVFSQQLEDFKPGVVDIVIFARSNEMRVNTGGGLLAHVSS